MATTIIRSGTSDNQAIVDDSGHLLVAGSLTATNPSVGLTGTTAPTSATGVAGIDPSGNLHALQTTAGGALIISSGTDAGFNTLTAGYPAQVSVSSVSTQIFPSNPMAVYRHIVNNTSTPIYIQYSSAAVVGEGILITGHTLCTLSGSNLWTGVINAISPPSTSLSISILEGTP